MSTLVVTTTLGAYPPTRVLLDQSQVGPLVLAVEGEG